MSEYNYINMSNNKRDYYQVLEINKNASLEDIKKAYRKMAIKYHPDRNPNDKKAEEKFKEAAEAYEILSDSNKRKKYDQFGHQSNYSSTQYSNVDVNDIFDQFGDIFGGHNPFESFFGSNQNKSSKRRFKGSNLKIKIVLDIYEITNGVSKNIKVKKMITCNICKGSGAQTSNSMVRCSTCNGRGNITYTTNTILGQMQTTKVCNNCNGEGTIIVNKCKNCYGSGLIKGEETININIPPGSVKDTQLSMSGKGDNAPHGGTPGDLIIIIDEKIHPFLKRDGNNIVYDLYINFIDGILGTHVEIPTINGNVKIKIEPGIQSGKILILKNKGIPEINSYYKGDQLIYVNLWTPKNITNEEKILLKKLQNSSNFQPNPNREEKSFFERMKEYFT